MDIIFFEFSFALSNMWKKFYSESKFALNDLRQNVFL